MDQACADTPTLVNACSDAATSPCPASLPVEYVAACRVGCMQETCPKEITCTESMSFHVPCGDCTDMHGSTFWASLIDHGEACSELVFDPSHAPTAEEQAQFSQCLRMTMEQKCPGLVGTGWEVKIPK